MLVATLKLKLQNLKLKKPVYHLLFQELALKSYLHSYLKLSVGWWVIFENILYRLAKKNLDHSGHKTSIIKETKKIWNLPVLNNSQQLYQIMLLKFFWIRLAGLFLIHFGDLPAAQVLKQILFLFSPKTTLWGNKCSAMLLVLFCFLILFLVICQPVGLVHAIIESESCRGHSFHICGIHDVCFYFYHTCTVG